MRVLTVVLCSALCSLAACRAKNEDARPAASSERTGDEDDDRLRAPKVVLDSEQLTLNGRRILARAKLEPRKAQRIDPLLDAAKALRERWQWTHPGKEWSSSAQVIVPDDLSFQEGLSLASTLAFAGYARDMTMRAGDRSIELDVVTDFMHDDEARSGSQTFLEICRLDGWQARRMEKRVLLPQHPMRNQISDWHPVTAVTRGLVLAAPGSASGSVRS